MTQYYCEKHDNYHVTDTSGCEECQAEWEAEEDDKERLKEMNRE